MNATSGDYLGNRAAAQPGVMRRAVAFSLALHVVIAATAGLVWQKRVSGEGTQQLEITIEFAVEVDSSVASAEVAPSGVEVIPLPRDNVAEPLSMPMPVPAPVPDPPLVTESVLRDAVSESVAEPQPATVVSTLATRPAVVGGPATNAVAAAATGSGAVRTTGLPKPEGGGNLKPGVLAQPSYRRNPEPSYPLAARRRRQEGVVLLVVEVTPTGRAAGVAVQRSSGFKLLDDAAARAVENWEFEPAREGAVAVASRIEVPVRFRLTE